MSGGTDVLALKDTDVTKLLAATTHLGSENVNYQMEQYVFKRRADGVHIINLGRTWEKLLLAARVIAAVEHPQEIFAISSRPFGQRAVLKFASYTGATPIAGRFTPGAFTNQAQNAFREPRLLIVTDPLSDHQPVTEASYVNIPVIAFCNTDSPLKYVDIAIPCNTKSTHSIGLMWWLLAREVLRLRGSIPRDQPWEIMVDLFFYRDPEDAEKEEQASKEILPPPKEPYHEDGAEDPSYPDELVPGSVVPPVATIASAVPLAAAAEDWNEDETVGPSDWGAANTGGF